MKKNLLIFIATIFIGCTPSQEKQEDIFTIPLDYDFANVLPFEESDLEVSYELIPIMTDTSNLEAFVNESAFIKAYKDYFYFFTSMGQQGGNFKIFDKKGKFIKSSINGNGPGELGSFLSDLYFDRENDLIQVVNLNKIVCYDLKGNYVRTIPIDINYSKMFKFGDYRFSCSDGTLDSGYVKIVNNNTERVVSFVVNKKQKQSQKKTLSINGQTVTINTMNKNCNFVASNSNLYFNFNADNYIYKMNKGDSIPSKFALIENVSSIEEAEAGKQDDNDKRFSSINNLAVIDDILFAFTPSGGNAGKKTRVIYDKKSNKTFKHPTPTAISIHSDGEYEYFQVGSNTFKIFEKANNETERAIIEEIEKINGDMETCIVKVKISRKK